MPSKQVIYKIKGMRRDESESAFSSDFSFENMNIRLAANTENTRLSARTENGTSPIDVLFNGVSGNIQGIPIGYSIVNDTLVLITTDNIPDTLNTFSFGMFRFLEYSDNDLIFKTIINENTSLKIEENLTISASITYDTDDGLVSMFVDMVRVPNPSTGVNYIIPNINIKSFFIINYVEVYYKSTTLYKKDLFTLVYLNQLNTDITGILSEEFPEYPIDATNIEESSTKISELNSYLRVTVNGNSEYYEDFGLWDSTPYENYSSYPSTLYTFYKETNTLEEVEQDNLYETPIGEPQYYWSIKVYNTKKVNSGIYGFQLDRVRLDLGLVEAESITIHPLYKGNLNLNDVKIESLNTSVATVSNIVKQDNYITCTITSGTPGTSFIKISSISNPLIYNMFAVNTLDLAILSFSFPYSTTDNRNVTFNLTYQSTASELMISESSSFAGASWQDINTSTFTLSEGYGLKTVYIKIRNPYLGLTSATEVATITYDVAMTVTLFTVGESEIISSPDTNFTFTVNKDADQFKISERSDFLGVSWRDISLGNTFTTSISDGLKTVYFKVRNSSTLEESGVIADTVTLYKPPVINIEGYQDITEGIVSIDLTGSLYAATTKYIVKTAGDPIPSSSDWSTATSVTYSDYLNINTGYGIFDIYIRVYNSYGYSGDSIINVVVDNPVTTWSPNPLNVSSLSGQYTITFTNPVKLSYIAFSDLVGPTLPDEGWIHIDETSEVTYDDFGEILVINIDENDGDSRNAHLEIDALSGEGLSDVIINQSSD